MAKRGRRSRPPSRYVISESTALGALADQAAASVDFDDTFSRDHFAVSIHASYSMIGHTAGEGVIHILVGHSDYSDAEIAEWWLAANSWDTGDLPAQEKAKRKIRHIGTLPGVAVEEVLDEGRMQKTPLRFMIEDGDTLFLAGVNDSGSVLTTGTVLKASGAVYARPT